MRGMGGLIGNFCKLPKFAKYLVGGVLFKFGVDNISKAMDQIENAANMLVDLMEHGGDIFSYVHAISEMTQGIGFLCGSVKFTTDVSVGMYRQCFVAGTKVKTEDGDKNIEEIKAGDKVWSYNPATGETGLKTVKQTFENETKQIVHVTISDGKDIEEIDTTVRHPFYVVGYGFKYASELRIGDKVISVSGDIYEVTSLKIENLDTPVKVYNFEVEDWHTYFVSASGIMVHNQCDTLGEGTTNASTTEDDKKQDIQTTSTTTITTKPATGNVTTGAKIGKSGSKVPNPYGKKGCPDHQLVIKQIEQDAKDRGLSSDTEYQIKTPGGFKNTRYADVVVLDSQGRVMEIHQVGKTTPKKGIPVARERKAIRDIRSSKEYNGAKIIYHPYDKKKE